ncbi:MAG: LacI family DNA-binding transcriptional regulator [Saprospiraceae bacterium]|nr:LacI family DNA-binding transcriptional regulator [Saprospiraceae bacterium]MCB9326657.1 LacI family DNA-binding transcriptional regulator [Lewinellaceae bacterium]
MDKKTTIYDIAKKLNITAATVSRALNNNPKISEATRKLVMETADEMNYKQNRVALALKKGRSNNVGVIVPYINRSFFASIIQGIEEELYPFGYHVIICQSHDEKKKEVESIHTLLNAQVDGILMSMSNTVLDLQEINIVLGKSVPLVFFDRKKDIKGVSSVTLNDFAGAYIVTQHLIEEGCKRIAHLPGDRSLDIYQDRFEGYRQALVDHGMEPDERYVIETKSDVEAGKISTRQLMELDNPPDAIFAAGDFAALGAIQELKSRGIRIPEDFCVAGFSNEPFTKFMELSMTSVDQFPTEMGRCAARVFLEQVKLEEPVEQQQKVILEPKLFIRKSTSRSGLS